MSLFSKRFRELRLKSGLTQSQLGKRINKSKSSVNMYERGDREPGFETLEAIADLFNVDMDYLLGKSDIPNRYQYDRIFGGKSPNITEDIISFPVLGEIAAGFDYNAVEYYDYDDTVEFPISYLHGRPKTDFLVLRVKGDSMYPLYIDGDIVLIKKTPTVDRSGDIAAIIYEDYATIKKLEFTPGEDKVKLVPINPEYQPKELTGVDLEQFYVLGVPQLLVRDLNSNEE